MQDCNVLIVDNNKIRRKLLASFLRELDCTFTEVVNGKEAIEMLTHNTFDIIFIDINLPVINGIETTKIIRKKLPFPKNRIKIIANTPDNYKDFFSEYYDVGFNDVMPNPNTIDNLKTLINYHIR